jgi:hypothetical protein
MPNQSKAESKSSATKSTPSLTYYPAYTHSAHPLQNKWVKLPSILIDKLQIPLGYEASHPGIAVTGGAPSSNTSAFPLFHYLNHPLPYIHVCGIVVSVEYREKLLAWAIQIDDSSGVILEALCKKVIDPLLVRSQYGNDPRSTELHLAGPGQVIKPVVPEWRCCGWLGDEQLDIRTVEVGTVLKIKGRVGLWKRGRQVLVERLGMLQISCSLISIQPCLLLKT